VKLYEFADIISSKVTICFSQLSEALLDSANFYKAREEYRPIKTNIVAWSCADEIHVT
jgi:hypothetical protein